jgi:glycosyltransferase involved in cell wall biosynthesis
MTPSFRRAYCTDIFCRVLIDHKHAAGASYVTSTRLHDRYPALQSKKTIFASSIELLDSQISFRAKNYSNKKEFKLICVGALEDWRKGPDTALRAVSQLRSKNFNVSLTWIGDGRNRTSVEKMTNDLNLNNAVNFRGHLPSGEAIFKALDEADIFILPTRGEGLPRAMIEAMSRGLVCVGSDVGGIPELISKEFMHQAEDYEELACIIEYLIKNENVMNTEASRNWVKSQDYLSQKLQERRSLLYNELKGITDDWKKKNITSC